MMDGNRIRVRLFDPKLGPTESLQLASRFEYVEQLTFHVLQTKNVGAVYRSLFGLKIMNKSIWFAPNQKIHDLLKLLRKNPGKNLVELRMRFRPSFLVELKDRDQNALDMIYAQLRYDFIHSKFNDEKRDFVLPNPPVLRLISIDLMRHTLENELTVDQLFQEIRPRDFTPHKVPRWQGALLFWMRDAMNIRKSVEMRLRSNYNQDKLVQAKLEFVETFLNEVCCDYGSETYRICHVDDPDHRMELRVRYERSSDDVSCVIETRLISNGKPKTRKDWVQLCDIFSICYATLRGQAVEINRENGKPFRVNFESVLHAKSLLALIDGYYRLMRKWHFNFCRDVISPDLKFLRSIKCHGPIGSETSRVLLREVRKPVAFLVRRCMEHSDRYIVEVLLNRQPNYIRLAIDIVWDAVRNVYQRRNFETNRRVNLTLKTDQDEYKSLKDLVNDIQICFDSPNQPPELLRHWLPPSEYGDYPALLLSISQKKLRKLIEQIESDHHQKINELPKIIPNRILERSKRPPSNAGNSFDVVFAKLGGEREVIIKTLSGNCNLKSESKRLAIEVTNQSETALGPLLSSERLRLADWIFVKGPMFAETIGLEFATFSLIQEYFPLGTLEDFLKKESNVSEFLRKLISCQIANAVLFLQEKRIVHGKIRCHNIFLKKITPLQVKLSDPLGTIDSEKDLAFIADEYRGVNGKLLVHDYDPALDVWSLGTTLWQVYSGGWRPPEKTFAALLKQPAKCPDTVWSIIESCWILDPARRASPQAVHRDLTDALAWENDAHKYDYISQDDQDPPYLQSANEIILKPVSSESCTPIPGYQSENCSQITNGSESNLLSQVGEKNSIDEQAIKAKASNKLTRSSSLIIARSRGRQLYDNIISFKKIFSSSSSQGNGSNGSIFNLSNYTTHPCSEATKLTDFYDIESICSSAERCVWQVDANRLKLGVEIGRGSSGLVMKGQLLQSDGESHCVAVKCINNMDSHNSNQLADLKKEFDILRNLDHECIIKTLGFVEESYLMLIVEYMPLGDLQSRLRNSLASNLHDFPLHKYALDIARGMEYLESMKVVHRDLALRNILVKNDNEVKICDFGLAQFVGPENHYKLQSGRALPVKWYAPETLRTWEFTFKSDVWSYGVVLWEMYSGGASPQYSGTYKDLLDTLKHERLAMPRDCPQPMYDLMMGCWAYEPEERDSFTCIIRKLMDQVLTDQQTISNVCVSQSLDESG